MRDVSILVTDGCASSNVSLALRLSGFNAMGKHDDIAKYCQTIAALARSMFAQAVSLVGNPIIGVRHACIGISDCGKVPACFDLG
jgi:hypothetical protein